MGEAIEMIQTGDSDGEMIVMNGDGVTSIPFTLEPAVRLPCTDDAEQQAIYDLYTWIRSTDEDRFWQLETAFLQFDMNPGHECFVADEIRALRAFLAEQQGTTRWNDAVARLLARFESAETALPPTPGG
ncbi:hypothetical protein ACPB9J_33735 [Streptomyces lavendulocolor]|uniref:hypothetical protein n=1 Tax=Streptomyces lavendulocolor TaxID=67316 RepID=UPI003C2D47AC